MSFWKDANASNRGSFDLSQDASYAYANEPFSQKFKTQENNEFDQFFGLKYRKHQDLYNNQNILRSIKLGKNNKDSKIEQFLQTLNNFSN